MATNMLAARFPATAAAAIAALALTAGASAGIVGDDFAYNDFSSTSGLNLVGAAAQSGNALNLTPASVRVAGGVWHANRVNVAGGFETTFQFFVQNKLGIGADGVAFVIQNAGGNVLGGTGGAMGYATNSFYNQTGIANSLAVEFDMWNNNIGHDWNDFNNGNHISIQAAGANHANSADSSASLGMAAINDVDMKNGALITASIVYNLGVLSIYLNDLATPRLSIAVNLSDYLNLHNGTHAFVGLTAATGGSQDAQSHVLSSWTFGNTIPAPGAAGLLAAAGLFAARRRRAA